MGEPTAVKQEAEVVVKKEKMEAESEDAQVAKKMKVEPEVVVKKEKMEGESEDAQEAKMKVEPEVVIKKEKMEGESEDAPAAKKMKVQPEAGEAAVKAENETQSGNGKVTETAEERGDPDLEKLIIRQVEYYFGDTYLSKTKYLRKQVKLEDGWVPLEVMLRFQRLAQLSKNASTIVSCLKNGSTLMEINEDGTKIRRSPSQPLPEMNEEWHKEHNDCTVYCKGFPPNEYDLNKYIKFFDAYASTNIHLRKYVDKPSKKHVFKGSAYVQFQTKELAEKFIALESVTFEGQDLLRMTYAAHIEEKKKEQKERLGKKVKKKGSAPEEKSEPERELAKGCILKVNGNINEELTWKEIRSILVDLGAKVAYIQYSKGEKEALVRLQSLEDGAAAEFVKKLNDEEKKVKIGQEEMEVSALEGEEEEAFLQKTRDQLERKRARMRTQPSLLRS